MKKGSVFKSLCRKYFKYLENEYECTFTSKKDVFGEHVIYRNHTTAIEINFVPRDAGMAYVWIIRLVDGKIVDNPVKIKSNSILTKFDLEDLLSIRAPSLKIERPLEASLMKSPFTVHEYENTIVQLAEALKCYAKDILSGDFKVFTRLEKIVKKRR